MKFDFYLSEMSVSDHHGGGLTLQRVLGEDLTNIPYFVHITKFGADLPATEKFKDKSINLWSFWETDWVKKTIGNTRARKIARNLIMIKLHAKKAARILNNKFPEKKELSVFVCPQSANSIFAIEALKKIRKLSYVTWVMDDHLVKYIDGRWEYEKGIGPVFAKHLQGARQVFVISPAMQAFYKERFGVESTVLFGSADVATSNIELRPHQTENLKLGYFGAVAAWQLDALQLVARALNHNSAQLHIYSGADGLPAELCKEGVYFEGRISPANVLPTMRNYDAILLPISFLETMRNMSEFNIATKMSEYLASGVPILAVGPPYAAMIKYLRLHNAAIIAEDGNESDIEAALDLLGNRTKVKEILCNALALAKNETGNQPMRKKWERIVID
jgi:glycosyltransferase involved in cell wall biosynthesis